MPTWMRQFHLKKINAFLKEQKEAQEKALKQNSQPLSKTISGPNVNPSAVYNFKK